MSDYGDGDGDGGIDYTDLAGLKPAIDVSMVYTEYLPLRFKRSALFGIRSAIPVRYIPYGIDNACNHV